MGFSFMSMIFFSNEFVPEYQAIFVCVCYFKSLLKILVLPSDWVTRSHLHLEN